MKSGFMVIVAIVFCVSGAKAQIQKGNVLVGGDISQLNLSLNTGNGFSVGLDPKAAWFIRDNFAIGGYLTFDLYTFDGDGVNSSYGIGPLARYYFNGKNTDLQKRLRLFVEANAGLQGYGIGQGDTRNWLALGCGPGLTYFITPNVGLEGLLKYQAIVGFNSDETTSNLTFTIGFQIYLHKKRR